jgi:hypothetical protein
LTLSVIEQDGVWYQKFLDAMAKDKQDADQYKATNKLPKKDEKTVPEEVTPKLPSEVLAESAKPNTISIPIVTDKPPTKVESQDPVTGTDPKVEIAEEVVESVEAITEDDKERYSTPKEWPTEAGKPQEKLISGYLPTEVSEEEPKVVEEPLVIIPPAIEPIVEPEVISPATPAEPAVEIVDVTPLGKPAELPLNLEPAETAEKMSPAKVENSAPILITLSVASLFAFILGLTGPNLSLVDRDILVGMGFILAILVLICLR